MSYFNQDYFVFLHGLIKFLRNFKTYSKFFNYYNLDVRRKTYWARYKGLRVSETMYIIWR